MNYIGVDIGGTKTAVVLGDELGNILKKERFATKPVNETIETVIEMIAGMGEFSAIGISCGGPLDANEGIIQSPPNLPGWDDIHITEILSQRFHVPAYLSNDADACALAEWKYGAGKGTQNMIFLTFGTGMGAGLILNGKIYRGANGNAGEVGHIRLAENGPEGYHKHGSFEGFCSGGGIAKLGKQMVKEAFANDEKVSFCTPKNFDKLDAKIIGDAAEAGDILAKKIYGASAQKLGAGLSVLIDIFNPECIVIGSIFARSQSLFVEKMTEVLEKEALPQNLARCKILPAALGDRIGDIAALTVAMESFF